MTDNHIPRLRSIPSVGPLKNQGAFDHRQPTPCGGCQCIIADGAHITKYRRTWWHVGCAEQDVASGNVHAAWLALGHDLARSPRDYKVGESRAIVGALLGMIGDPDAYSSRSAE